MDNVVETVMEEMIEIEPLDRDGFLKVRETLTRVGVASEQDDGTKVLTQVCHVLKKRDGYYICHFKHLFLLDGKTDKTNYTAHDDRRLVKIAKLLRDWGLITVMYPEVLDGPDCHVAVVPFKEKDNYVLKCNYRIGKKNAKKAED